MKRNRMILYTDLENVIKPNIAILLRQCGLSVRDVARLCRHAPWLLSFSPERIKEFVLRAEELGVHRSSPMFKLAVQTVAGVRKERVDLRLNFMKNTLACSEKEAPIAVSKKPSILELSEENLVLKIQFLLNVVGLEPGNIVDRPVLLSYSLEKRLVPRHCVMKVLMEKGLLNCTRSFCTLLQPGEEAFKLKFIDCHKDSVPGLADVCAAACAGVVPSRL